MDFRKRGVTILITIFLAAILVASPAAASQDIGVKAADTQGEPGETVALKVAVANGHEQAPAENVTVAVDTKSSELAFNRTNVTVSVEPEEVKKVTFEADIGENADPSNYSVTAEALRGEKSIDNTTAVVTVTDSSANRNTGESDGESPGSSKSVTEEEECTTVMDWIDGEIEFGEWDQLWCSDDDDDSSWLDQLFD